MARLSTFLIAFTCFAGCSKAPVDNDFGELTAVEEPEAPPEEDEPTEEVAIEAPANKGNVFMRNQPPLVELKAAKEENPKLYETVNTSTSNNYLTAVKDSGFAATSKLQIATLNREVETLRALDGSYPNFDRFKTYIDESGMQFAGLKPYQMYAYDEENHKVVMLEDPDLRKQILGE